MRPALCKYRTVLASRSSTCEKPFRLLQQMCLISIAEDRAIRWNVSIHFQVHVEREQMPCHLTKTTPETHRLIEENLEETPVYGGWVDSKGPRYCPSIEDKIVRFKDKESHQVNLALLICTSATRVFLAFAKMNAS